MGVTILARIAKTGLTVSLKWIEADTTSQQVDRDPTHIWMLLPFPERSVSLPTNDDLLENLSKIDFLYLGVFG